jgi:hypothetical protein
MHSVNPFLAEYYQYGRRLTYVSSPSGTLPLERWRRSPITTTPSTGIDASEVLVLDLPAARGSIYPERVTNLAARSDFNGPNVAAGV